jgi:putative hydrolase of the HAD superfamily
MDSIGKIQAVIFDLDQTLTDREKSMRKMAELFAAEFGPALRTCPVETVHSAMKRADARGFRPRAQFAGDLLEMLPWKNPPAAQTLMDFWESKFPQCAFARDGAKEILEHLKSRGLKLAICTNGKVPPQMAKLDIIGLRSYFDAILISDATGTKKPESAFYQLALDALKCSASSAVFVGDQPLFDVITPQKLGMSAIWLTGTFDWPTDAPPPVYTIRELGELSLLI